MKSRTRRIKRKRGGVVFSNTVPVREYNKTARPVMNAKNNNSVAATVGNGNENNDLPYMNIESKALKPEAAERYGPFRPAKNEADILARMRERMPYPYATENAHAAAEYAYYSNNLPTARRKLSETLKLRKLNPLERAEYEELINKKVPIQGLRKTIQQTMNSNMLPSSSKNAIVGYLRASKVVRNAEKMIPKN